MYKLYQSKEWIWWDSPNGVDYPTFKGIDDRLNFQLVPDHTIHFETYNKGKIVVKDNDVTYFKLEKENKLPTYWFVKNIDKVLKDGYVYNIELDYYSTYTARLLNALSALKNQNILIYANRVTFQTWMLENEKIKELIIHSTTLKDQLIENIPKVFKNVTFKKVLGRDQVQVLNPDGNKFWNLRLDTSVKYEFLGNMNVCAVFIQKRYGTYIAIPLIQKESIAELDALQKSILQLDDGTRRYNLINNINDLLRIMPYNSFYGTDAFVGIFRFPDARRAYFSGSLEVKPIGNGHSIGIQETQVPAGTYYWVYFRFDPSNPTTITHPLNYRFEPSTSLINVFTDLQDEVQWSKARKKKLDYFKFVKKYAGDVYIINPSIYSTFSNEFIIIPKLNSYTSSNDIEGFGGTLPSPTSDYVKKVYDARKNYDMGLTSLANSFISQGSNAAISTAIGGLGAGAVSLLGSGISTVLNGLQLEKSYKYALAGASQSWVNSQSTDLEYLNMYKLINDYDNTMMFPKQLNQVFQTPWYEYNLSEQSKEVIRDTYSMFGFPVNNYISFYEMIDLTKNKSRFYLQLDRDWITNGIRILSDLDHYVRNESSEVLQVIANQLANGVRIWFVDKPNYGWRD